MKTYKEISAAVEAKPTTDDKLCLVFEWVKTGVMNKSQFIGILNELISAESAESSASSQS